MGGTGFLGRRIALAALELQHKITCLARGSSPVPDGAGFVRADRDNERGLDPVTGTQWDVVIDVSSQPGHVRRAVRDIETSHWVYVSSANAYADFSGLEQDEQSALLDALDGDVMGDMSSYGEAKVACEAAVRSAKVSSTVIRSGLIGGPGDDSGRSGYWPWRFAHPSGADVIVPDDLSFPCAMIDVRDLAAWIIFVAEQKLDGIFNATGPTTSFGEVLSLAAEAASARTPVRPVAVELLAEMGISPWMGPASLPLWIDDPKLRGFATLDTTRAHKAGLVTRPLIETLRDALAYEEERTSVRPTGLSDADEQRVREALKAG